MNWSGDQNVDWSYSDGLPSTLPAALSLGLSGFGLNHFDIGGYTTLTVPSPPPDQSRTRGYFRDIFLDFKCFKCLFNFSLLSS